MFVFMFMLFIINNNNIIIISIVIIPDPQADLPHPHTGWRQHKDGMSHFARCPSLENTLANETGALSAYTAYAAKRDNANSVVISVGL